MAETMKRLNPETAFFLAHDGKRSANFVFDLKDPSDIPSIAEPWFMEMNAAVEFFPCMNAEDVRRGLEKAMSQMAQPVGV
ncbi:MAG TPA: hypothetical protein VFE17_05610 [Candidatus Baltobacteraceae bacterium]|jgi:hypothetical protein|nr:hypothetical protein [Candidatus Baltobacteraceae bacterium]